MALHLLIQRHPPPASVNPRHPVTRVRVPELSSPSLAYLVLSLYRLYLSFSIISDLM